MRKSNRTVTLGALVALTVLGVPSIASADAITVGDGWHSFSWVGGPNAVQTQSAFTFTSAAPVTVQVTDAFVYGDRFQLSDKGSLVGTTSQLTNTGPTPGWTDNPNTAFSGGFSNGSFTLAAGSHSLVLKDIAIPYSLDSGAAFFRVVGSGAGTGSVSSTGNAPEPSSLALLGVGLVGLTVRRFRRRGARRTEVAVA